MTFALNNDFFADRVRNKSMEKFQDQAGIQTQDLLNTSQTLLPFGPLAKEWKTSYINSTA